LRPSGNQFRGLLRILIKKPSLFRRVYVEYSLGRIRQKMDTKFLLTTIGFASLFATSIFAADDSLLARITVYWRGEGQLRASSNGARLCAGHCAVDPKRIPYGSHVVFPDATCTAVDSGPAVVNRKAARVTGRTVSQRNAIVIDRFFESREAALAWERSHPHFMTVRIVQPESREKSKVSGPEAPRNETRIAASRERKSLKLAVNANGMKLARPSVAKPNITKSQPIALSPATATNAAAASSTGAVAATTKASAAGPIAAIIRNPLGRLGR